MLEKIKEALKKAGLDESHAEKLASTITDESQIDSAVADLKKESNKSMTPEQFKKFLDENGLAGVLEKMVQSEFDRKITKAIETHDKNLREKGLLKDNPDTKDDNKGKESSENPEIAELRKLVSQQGETIKTLLDDRKKQTREQMVKTALKEAQISENFFGHITGETEDDIKASVKSLKDNIAGAKQKEIDELLKQHGIPRGSSGNGTTALEDEAVAIAKAANERDKATAESLAKIGGE